MLPLYPHNQQHSSLWVVSLMLSPISLITTTPFYLPLLSLLCYNVKVVPGLLSVMFTDFSLIVGTNRSSSILTRIIILADLHPSFTVLVLLIPIWVKIMNFTQSSFSPCPSPPDLHLLSFTSHSLTHSPHSLCHTHSLTSPHSLSYSFTLSHSLAQSDSITSSSSPRYIANDILWWWFENI